MPGSGSSGCRPMGGSTRRFWRAFVPPAATTSRAWTMTCSIRPKHWLRSWARRARDTMPSTRDSMRRVTPRGGGRAARPCDGSTGSSSARPGTLRSPVSASCGGTWSISCVRMRDRPRTSADRCCSPAGRPQRCPWPTRRVRAGRAATRPLRCWPSSRAWCWSGRGCRAISRWRWARYSSSARQAFRRSGPRRVHSPRCP